MKLRLPIIMIPIVFAALASPATSSAKTVSPLSQRLSGRILLQTESYGRAWYVNPDDGTRYYLKDGQTAYEMMKKLGLGVTHAHLSKIPIQPGRRTDQKLLRRFLGRILLDVENNGEAWYVNPVDGLRYYLKDGETTYQLMRKFALGIRNDDLAKIPMNPTQLVPDTAFADTAYALIRNTQLIAGNHQDTTLTPASVTKLMSALVLFDQKLEWNKTITITRPQLEYPTMYVGNDKTSEIDLTEGDQVTVYDLWVAMLVASSNQATIALVDASGLTRAEFVQAMNEKAASLGLAKTKFFDPTGLDAHNVTTPRELALIAKLAFSKPEIANATRQNGYVINTQSPISRSITVVDRNYSLNNYKPDAAKTGYLVEAGLCSALKKGNDIIVIMRARSTKERNKILDYLTNI